MNLMRRSIYIPLLAVIFLITASPAFANYSPLPDRASISTLPSVVLLDFASDTFFILVSLLLLRQIGTQRLSTVVKVCLLAMVAGFTADAAGVKIISFINGDQVSGMQILQAFPICILLIACANYCFGRYYFKFDDKQSMIMGIVMGICTMPVGLFLTSEVMSGRGSNGFHNSYQNVIDQSYSFAVIGIIFAAADILLLWIVKPLSTLSAARIALIGLITSASVSILFLIPTLNAKKETSQILACSANMRYLSEVLKMYAQEYHDFPSSLSVLQSQYKIDAGRLYCSLDKKRLGTTSYEYRKPPAYILHPEILGIVQCPLHRLPPGYQSCEYCRKNLDTKIRSYVIDNAKPLDDLSILVKNGICEDRDIYCYYVPRNGQKARYILDKPTDVKLQKIRDSMANNNGAGSQTIYKPGLSAELLEFYNSQHRIVRCPYHPDTDENSGECESRRDTILYQIIEYKHKHGSLPTSLDQVEHVNTTCPSTGADGKAMKYTYHKPPDDFDSADAYWILKCTHHPKYDVYQSAGEMASMKALPKGESYK